MLKSLISAMRHHLKECQLSKNVSHFDLKSDEFSSAFLMPFSFEGGRRPTVL
jgi:hypothetical protein